MNEKIEMIIYEAVDQLNKLSKKQYHLKKGVNTALFGKDGKLDSLGFVNLLVIIEQNIEDEFDVSITIANEKAMSEKNNPFRTIGTLVDYIDKNLKEV